MLKAPERKPEEITREDVLRMLYDLKASNDVFGFIGHKKNMGDVIDRIICEVKNNGPVWRQ